MANAYEIRARSRCVLHYCCVLLPLVVLGALVVITVVALTASSWRLAADMSETDAGAMDVAFRHVAASMMHLLEANRSAFAIASTVMNSTGSDLFSHVGPELFVAFAMQPLLAQVSYAGLDGAAFSYYRADDHGGEAKALFTDSRGRWFTQAVDPATGHPVGSAAAVAPSSTAGLPLPNTTLGVLAASKEGSYASLGDGWAPVVGTRMLFFSAPVGDYAGVVSAAVAVDDVVGATSADGFKQYGMDVYYAVVDDKVDAGAVPASAYKPVLARGAQSGGDDDATTRAEEMGFFSDVECAASAIDAPELGQLRTVGDYGKYRIACTNFDVSGVRVVLRLVLHNKRFDADMIQTECMSVLIVVGVLLAVAAVVGVLAVRALRRADKRKAVLKAELVRQNEALRQAERKSMNKSNAFASASHDIRSALSAIAGLVDMCRPEAQSHPNIIDNLNQMGVCTNKLFDILNSILDTTKVESGKMHLEQTEFNMADVLEESVDMANVVGVSKGIEVVWDPCDFSVLRCANVTGDSKRLKQILDNLLGNALKFTHEGHVVLRAWANRPIARSSIIGSAPSRFTSCGPRGGGGCGFLTCLLFGSREDDDRERDHQMHDGFNVAPQSDPNLVEFYFEVDDTGIGIPREKWESVFENYVQVKDGQGGTGLGLGIVQSFVRLMGGEISIKEKEPGERGTCFGFNVLLKTSESRQEQPQDDDIEEGTAAAGLSTTTLTDSNLIRASAFQESYNFKGMHCVLYVHGVETRRIMQTWMETIGMKVWLVPQAEFLASTLEKVLCVSTTSPTASSPPSLMTHDVVTADRCFSSKEMVSQVLRNSNGQRRFSVGGSGYPSGLLVLTDVSSGSLEQICQEMVRCSKIKRQIPSKVIFLVDLKTSSDDLKRFKELAGRWDLVLRKPMHGSRLYTVLCALRELQLSDAQSSYSQVTPEVVAGTSRQPESEEIVVLQAADVQQAATDAVREVAPAQQLKVEEDKPLAGMSVLLAEDTLVLQAIQKKILTQLGATVTLAVDGSEAVKLHKQALEQMSTVSKEGSVVQSSLPYNVILMDCQMPIIDGYNATKLIREEERSYGVHTPIIALTANTMEEDLQKTIDAGMDSYLTKPVERKRLVEAVSRICGTKG